MLLAGLRGGEPMALGKALAAIGRNIGVNAMEGRNVKRLQCVGIADGACRAHFQSTGQSVSGNHSEKVVTCELMRMSLSSRKNVARRQKWK